MFDIILILNKPAVYLLHTIKENNKIMKNTYTELNGLLQDVQIKIKGDSGVNQVQTWDGSFCAFRTDSELFTNKAKAEKYFGHKVWAV